MGYSPPPLLERPQARRPSPPRPSEGGRHTLVLLVVVAALLVAVFAPQILRLLDPVETALRP